MTVAKKENLKSLHHKEKLCNCVVRMLTRTIVMIILQFIHIWNHVICMKLIECYLAIIPHLQKILQLFLPSYGSPELASGMKPLF